jgi:hypothetical protein
MFKKLAIITAVLTFGMIGLEAKHSGNGAGSLAFIGSAEARVGRPLTPVSVAGVARRTVRRCAVGVYYC